MSSAEHNGERPAKRPRLSPVALDAGAEAIIHAPGQKAFSVDPKEIEMGIVDYVSDDVVSFHGILKMRYTDFMVNEILQDGEVVHLTSTTIARARKFQSAVSNQRKAGHDSEHVRGFSNGTSEPKATSEVVTKKDEPSTGGDTVAAERPLPEQISQPGQISDADKQQMVSYLNEEAVNELLDLYTTIVQHPQRKPKDHASVRTEFTSDRSLRTEIHGAIRRIFNHKIESSTDKDGFLCLTAAKPDTRKPQTNRNNEAKPIQYPGKLGWLERGGEYVHFTLYKENKDTMEAIGFLTRQLKINAKAFQFAGTKDRRAVTVQRVSAYRIEAERLAKQSHHLRNAAVGDFVYQQSGLELGDLGGNEFVITLRECGFPGFPDTPQDDSILQIQSALELAVSNLYNKGFLNYYGLQRFGTFATSTDTVGLHILKNDFRSACEAILHYDPEALAAADEEEAGNEASTPPPTAYIGYSRDERARAKAIALYETTSNAHKPLEILPRKFTAENQVMRNLARSPTDYVNALLAIPRNLRLMYVHAYQSLVWNKAVSHRWQTYGNQVVEGDLVLIKEHKDKEAGNATDTTATATAEVEAPLSNVDADGEIIIVPQSHDRATQVDDVFDRARALTAAEASSGNYNIFDVVLPLPGFDIIYPPHASGQFYKDFMGSVAGGGLDPYDMRRKQKDFSLSGGYRKVMARIGEVFSVDVKRYARDEEQFVETDLEKLNKREGSEMKVGFGQGGMQDVTMLDTSASREGVVEGDIAKEQDEVKEDEVKDKIAAVLKFQLGASQYATVALRELSRGGITAYQADANARK